MPVKMLPTRREVRWPLDLDALAAEDMAREPGRGPEDRLDYFRDRRQQMKTKSRRKRRSE